MLSSDAIAQALYTVMINDSQLMALIGDAQQRQPSHARRGVRTVPAYDRIHMTAADEDEIAPYIVHDVQESDTYDATDNTKVGIYTVDIYTDGDKAPATKQGGDIAERVIQLIGDKVITQDDGGDYLNLRIWSGTNRKLQTTTSTKWHRRLSFRLRWQDVSSRKNQLIGDC